MKEFKYRVIMRIIIRSLIIVLNLNNNKIKYICQNNKNNIYLIIIVI